MVQVMAREPKPEDIDWYDVAHQEFADKLAPHYDSVESSLGTRLFKKREAQVIQSIVRRGTERKDGTEHRVLDIGCGTGRIEELLKDAPGVRVVGVDFSANMLTLAEQKVKAGNIEFQMACAEKLPFPGESFDVVLQAFGVPSYTQQPASIREVARVLKPDGVALLVPYNREGINIAATALPWPTSMTARLDLTENQMTVNGDSFRCEAFTVGGIHGLAQRAGLRIVSWETFPVLATLLPEQGLYDLALRASGDSWKSREDLEEVLFLQELRLSRHQKQSGMYIIAIATKERANGD